MKRSIYKAGEEFVISEDEVWLPGCYETRVVAERAFKFRSDALNALQERKNREAGGSGGVITSHDLDALSLKADQS
jgi:hypothetical protein